MRIVTKETNAAIAANTEKAPDFPRLVAMVYVELLDHAADRTLSGLRSEHLVIIRQGDPIFPAELALSELGSILLVVPPVIGGDPLRVLPLVFSCCLTSAGFAGRANPSGLTPVFVELAGWLLGPAAMATPQDYRGCHGGYQPSLSRWPTKSGA